MRRLYLATLLLTAVSLMAGGCRQTTGPTSAGPLTPLGPMAPSGSLSPVGASQTPTLSPFGGATRVTPPSTGTFSSPNNYMGGIAPVGQTNSGIGTAGAFAAQGMEVIGSGVQAAGWNETRSFVAPTDQAFGAGGPVAPSNFGINPSNSGNPRSGGMQIIDLTQAPPPPGYRPAAPMWSNQLPAPNQLNPNWQQSPPNQSFQNQSTQSPVGVRSITAPGPSEIANRLTPLPSTSSNENPVNLAPFGSAVPRTATAPVQGPSTEPVTSGGVGGTQENLPWRRPGTRF